MTAERTVTVRLKAIVGDYEAAMAKAGLSTKGLGTSVSNLSSQVRNGEVSLKSLGGTFDGLVSGQTAVAAGAVVAAGMLVKLGKDGVGAYLSLAGQVRAYQRIAGGTAEESSRMVAAFHAVGLESDVGATAVFRLSQNIDRNAIALRNAGVVIARDRQGNVDLNKTLLNLSDAYRSIQDPQQRNVLMMQALGRGAIALAPLLAAGRGEIEKFWKAADQHGLVLSQQDLNQAREFKLAMRELGQSWEGFKVQAGKESVPSIEKWIKLATTALDKYHEFQNAKPTNSDNPISRLNKDIEHFVFSGGIYSGILHGHASASKEAADATAKLSAAQEFADKTFMSLSEATGVTIPRLKQLADTMGIDLTTATGKETSSLAAAAEKLNAAVTPTERLAAVTDTLSDAYATGAEKVKAFNDAVDAMLGSELSAEQASLTLRQSIQTLADDFATGQKKGESYRQFQDRLSGEMISVVRNIDAVRRAMTANGTITADAAAQQAFMVTALQNVAAQFPALRPQIDAYLKLLAQIPGSKNTIVTADTSPAIKAYEALHRAKIDAGEDARSEQQQAIYQRQQDIATFIGGIAAGAATGAIGAPTVGNVDTKANGADAVASYLKALHEEQLTELDNRFKEGQMSVADYVKALDGELAHEKMYSSQWEALQDKKRAALQQLDDFYQGVIDHQRQIEDNEYAVGVLSKDRYLALLQERLKGLEQYSDAWMTVWREIQQLESNSLDEQIKIIQAVDAQRQFDQAFYALAGQRAQSAAWQATAGMTPAQTSGIDYTRLAASMPASSGTTYSPNFTVSTSDPATAASLTNQKLRDAAMLLGV